MAFPSAMLAPGWWCSGRPNQAGMWLLKVLLKQREAFFERAPIERLFGVEHAHYFKEKAIRFELVVHACQQYTSLRLLAPFSAARREMSKALNSWPGQSVSTPLPSEYFLLREREACVSSFTSG
jgi:hypothetical protein